MERHDGKPDWSLETEARRGGFRRPAGIDEAGRGCLFGPVFAAAVVLDRKVRIEGLDDSKRLRPALRRELAARIRATAIGYRIEAVDAASIDLLNILQASRLAMRNAVEGLVPAPDILLVDAVEIDSGIPQRAVIKGDRRSCSIAAASILAKVARDNCMLAWDAIYPEYGLAAHKGYPSPAHLRALRVHGCTPQHRQSFGPVQRLTALPRVPVPPGIAPW